MSPASDIDMETDTRFGLYEGRELVAKNGRNGNAYYIVVDHKGHKLFRIPVRNCLLDVRFRNGKLQFRENATGRTGYIDRNGIVTFFSAATPAIPEQATREQAKFSPVPGEKKPLPTLPPIGEEVSTPAPNNDILKEIKENHPFYKEAAKVLSGKLEFDDAQRRRVILNYCEHFRTAYTTKDIDFLRQLFSEQALIIVGNVAKPQREKGQGYSGNERVTYYLRTKSEYLSRLSKAFAANKKIDMKFSDFRIMCHPTLDGIYGVSLHQQYHSDRYSDDGWLFLLWDFRNEAMPLIHVRTWQPATDVHHEGDVINMSDFNWQ